MSLADIAAATPGVELKNYLDELGCLGPIRVGFLDASPDEMGVIYEYGGINAEGRFGVVGVGWENPSIQILFRGAPNDYATPMARARIAWQHLMSVQPGALPNGNNTEYLKITPQQSPFSLGRDGNQRFEIVCNYYVMKERC